MHLFITGCVTSHPESPSLHLRELVFGLRQSYKFSIPLCLPAWCYSVLLRFVLITLSACCINGNDHMWVARGRVAQVTLIYFQPSARGLPLSNVWMELNIFACSSRGALKAGFNAGNKSQTVFINLIRSQSHSWCVPSLQPVPKGLQNFIFS